ncbi:MAG TPA: hypothetical protein VND64_34870 [Pirellulales bacterium]|nr:hypothetical protein [Pirellulales bacterium]
MCRRKLFALIVTLVCTATATAAEPLKVGTFHLDATPPLGSPLCDGLCPPAKEIVDRLSARGVVLVTDESPIVLCAIDWVGVGNGGYGAWRQALAKAAGTTESRVAVHCLHQHDAPGCDFDAEDLLAGHGMAGAAFHVAFAHETIDRAASAVRAAVANAQPVTHLGLGTGRVEKVASNRRILGPDGKVQFVRYSSCKDENVRSAPEGVIDPDVRLVSFFSGDRPVVSITYYATHPQSHYGQGGVSADFVGMARALREKELPDVVHIHFDGAGGNVAAGKYNDGTPPLRAILAERLAAGMKAAWENTRRVPIAAADVRWRRKNVLLPASPGLKEDQLVRLVEDSTAAPRERVRAARDLVWLRRCLASDPIELTCLRLGPAWVVHMPGELFVEYQLAAEKLRPQVVVCMAAYGDYGPGYIGTEVSYPQGGYETGPVSRVAPEVERVLMEALGELLK